MTREIIIFRLRVDINLKDFQTSIEEINALLQSQHGFIHRTIGKAEGGLMSQMGGAGWNESWLDIIDWESLEDAKQSTEEFLVHAAGVRFLEFYDRQYTQVFYIEGLRTAGM